MKIDREDYEAIRHMVLCEAFSISEVASHYATTKAEITAILRGNPQVNRPMGPLPVVATYVER